MQSLHCIVDHSVCGFILSQMSLHDAQTVGLPHFFPLQKPAHRACLRFPWNGLCKINTNQTIWHSDLLSYHYLYKKTSAMTNSVNALTYAAVTAPSDGTAGSIWPSSRDKQSIFASTLTLFIIVPSTFLFVLLGHHALWQHQKLVVTGDGITTKCWEDPFLWIQSVFPCHQQSTIQQYSHQNTKFVM